MYKAIKSTVLFITIMGGFLSSFAQAGADKSIDKVAAVVGSAAILKSDIEHKYAQYVMEGGKPDEQTKGFILNQLITEKFLGQQAIIDSITVTDEDVDDQIQRRMRYAIRQMGGPDKLEAFLNRSILQYQDEIRPEIREQLVAEKMQRKITEKVAITPLEIERYFKTIPADSLPNYSSDVEIGQVVAFPVLTKEEKQSFYDKAQALLDRIKAGTDKFETLASLYSQDPGSAIQGGELGFADRSAYVKEFSAMAFKLKQGEISPVFETKFGFHFLQVIERRGEQVNVRHILIKTEPTPASLARTKAHLDSVYNDVVAKKLPFSTAASLYSNDDETKYNGGMMINSESASRTTYIPADKLEASVFLAIDTMKVGTFSRPELFTGPDGKQGYRFFYLKSKTDPHRASLALDLPKIREMALDDKTSRTVSEWFEKRRKTTYVKIDGEYSDALALKSWVK